MSAGTVDIAEFWIGESQPWGSSRGFWRLAHSSETTGSRLRVRDRTSPRIRYIMSSVCRAWRVRFGASDWSAEYAQFVAHAQALRIQEAGSLKTSWSCGSRRELLNPAPPGHRILHHRRVDLLPCRLDTFSISCYGRRNIQVPAAPAGRLNCVQNSRRAYHPTRTRR